MNPEKLLNMAAEAIKNRQIGMTGPWQICFLDGKVQCITTRCMKKPEIIFLTISERNIQDGLSSIQWHKLLTAMARYWSQKKW